MQSSLPWCLVDRLRGGVAARLLAACALLMLVLAAGAADSNEALQRQASCKLAWAVDLRPRSTLTAVAVGQRGVWVTGEDGLVLHRDGKRWSPTTIPGVDAIVDIASGRASVWAVGAPRNGSGDPTGDYVYRWSGRRWQRVRIPGLPTARRGLEFSAVTVDAGDVWLAGRYDDTHSEKTIGAGGWVTARLHAGRWEVFSGGNGYTGLTAIAGVDAYDAWGVGGQGPTMASAQELMLHWNGAQWKEELPPSVSTSIEDLAAATDGTLWAVGGHFVAHARCK